MKLELWVVYDHPLDHPDCYVARRFENQTPTQVHLISPSIEKIRDCLAQQGLVCFPRCTNDDPCIMETWI